MQWEKIETAHMQFDAGLFGLTTGLDVMLSRAQVPGGWLVLAANTVGTAISITFYPDPTHSWNAGPTVKG